MNISAHRTTLRNHAVSWLVFHPNSNGKEKDWESGFHYYGARYYWSEVLTGWLSVDPMMDKYPNISSYNYCAWNPLNAADPTGMDSIRTPNGMVNVGDGYKATDDGYYLYGPGLQSKRWNPNLEIGGIVGDGLSGGYEDCSDVELAIGIDVRDKRSATIVGPVALPSFPVIPIGSVLPEIIADAVSKIGAAAVRVLGVLGGCLLLSGDSRPTQEMSQHGKSNKKLSPEEVLRCNDILSNPNSAKKEKVKAKQKLKTNEKAEGTRQSRQSKDKKTRR